MTTNRIRQHLTYANVISTLALFLVLGGGTALAAYVVSSNSQIGPGTVSGHKPPSGAHANIIVGSINGQDVGDNSLGGADINEAGLTGNVRRLVYWAGASPPPAPVTTLATVGPLKISGECLKENGSTQVRIFAGGAAVSPTRCSLSRRTMAPTSAPSPVASCLRTPG